MVLEFIEKRRGTHSRYSWTPFEPSDDFTPRYLSDDPWHIEVLRESVEVARVELDEAIG
jgi:hypothetical protein